MYLMQVMQLTFNYPICVRLNAHEKGNFVKNVSLLLHCAAVVGAEDCRGIAGQGPDPAPATTRVTRFS